MIKIKKKRKIFNIAWSTMDLAKELTELPDDCVYKFISDGGFSSISFIKYIAEHTIVKELWASTFRIGKKELWWIDTLHKHGRIGMCHFAVGSLMKNDSKRVKQYGYYDRFVDVCNNNNWEYLTINNHSKILLFDTEDGKFVIETSSNLNENPKIEQFSFEKDAELFDFYCDVFKGWREEDEG